MPTDRRVLMYISSHILRLTRHVASLQLGNLEKTGNWEGLRIPMGGVTVKSVFAALIAIGILSIGAARADDVINLKGSQAETVNLKGTTSGDAETISVFHGRLFGCCRGCCCPAPVGCCAPVPVYYGCVGGSGGYSAPPAAAGFGYGGNGPSQMYGYAAPARTQMFAPSYAFRPQNSFQFQYPQQPPRAVVALPRLGLAFSLGDSPDLLTSRYSNRYLPNPALADEPPARPPVQQVPDQFRYDGGPSNPVPMPGNLRPLPNVAPPSAPATNNRVKATTAPTGWMAYGERPSISTPTQLVRTRDR